MQAFAKWKFGIGAGGSSNRISSSRDVYTYDTANPTVLYFGKQELEMNYESTATIRLDLRNVEKNKNGFIGSLQYSLPSRLRQQKYLLGSQLYSSVGGSADSTIETSELWLGYALRSKKNFYAMVGSQAMNIRVITAENSPPSLILRNRVGFVFSIGWYLTERLTLDLTYTTSAVTVSPTINGFTPNVENASYTRGHIGLTVFPF